jgi:divalent metal cation (Fe/Co/Zn/Cd) transporter
MTDVWTSAGVVAAIAIVALTGWTRLDAVIALCVAVNILLTGARLLRRHTLRTRQAGVRSFISFHSARA